MAERRGTKALELWCRRMTEGYPGVEINNMTTSWRNGLAFCAMIHHFRPDLIEFEKLNKEDVYFNNELAFTTAEKYLGIPALLDADDMAAYEVPDRLSILTYLSQFYQVFAAQGSPNRLKRPSSAVEKSQISKATGPPPKMAHVVGVPKRDPCHKCNLPVFLAERLTVGKRVYHRTCLKCARCSSQLTPGSFYETEVDGEYVCETCPDEELINENPIDSTSSVLPNKVPSDENEVELRGAAALRTVGAAGSPLAPARTVRNSIASRLAFFEQNKEQTAPTSKITEIQSQQQHVIVDHKLMQKSVSDEEKSKSLKRIEQPEVLAALEPYKVNNALSQFLNDTIDGELRAETPDVSEATTTTTTTNESLAVTQMDTSDTEEEEEVLSSATDAADTDVHRPKLPVTQPPVDIAKYTLIQPPVATTKPRFTTTTAVNLINTNEAQISQNTRTTILKEIDNNTEPKIVLKRSEMKMQLIADIDETNNNALKIDDSQMTIEEEETPKIMLDLSESNVNESITKEHTAAIEEMKTEEHTAQGLLENLQPHNNERDTDKEENEKGKCDAVELRNDVTTGSGNHDQETADRLSVVRARLQKFEVIASKNNNETSSLSSIHSPPHNSQQIQQLETINTVEDQTSSISIETLTNESTVTLVPMYSKMELDTAMEEAIDVEVNNAAAKQEPIAAATTTTAVKVEELIVDARTTTAPIVENDTQNSDSNEVPLKIVTQENEIFVNNLEENDDKVEQEEQEVKDKDKDKIKQLAKANTQDEEKDPALEEQKSQAETIVQAMEQTIPEIVAHPATELMETTEATSSETLPTITTTGSSGTVSVEESSDLKVSTTPNKVVTIENYPKDLDPFADENDDDDDNNLNLAANNENKENHLPTQQRQPKPRSLDISSSSNTSKSLNPFDSSDDEIELEKSKTATTPSSGKVPPPRPPPPRISRNPFGDDPEDDDNDINTNFSRRSSLSLSLTKKTPVPTPRSNISQSQNPTPEPTPRLSNKTPQNVQLRHTNGNNNYYGSDNSLSTTGGSIVMTAASPATLTPNSLIRNSELRCSNNSLASSAGGTMRLRKTRRAPLPPTAPPVKELFPSTETISSSMTSTPSSSTRNSPKSTRKKRPAPAPPKPARLDPMIITEIENSSITSAPITPAEITTSATATVTDSKNSFNYPLQSELDSKLSDEEKALLEGKPLVSAGTFLSVTPTQSVTNLSRQGSRRLIPLDVSLLDDLGGDETGKSDDFKQKLQQQSEGDGQIVYRRRVLMPPKIETPIHDTNPLIDELLRQEQEQQQLQHQHQQHDRQLEKLKDNKEAQNRNRQSQISVASSSADDLENGMYYNKSSHGKWKRRKGPAPALPVPPRKVLQMLPLQEIRQELEIIEVQQQGLEKQGVILEKMIRDRCEDEHGQPVDLLAKELQVGDNSGRVQNSKEVEDLILQLFELVNEKNELFRRQAELMYLRRQHRLEQEQADLEYEIRVLMAQPERNKTDSDKAREETLIARLVDVVQLRNEVVESLEMDRLRENEEDMSIKQRLEMHTSNREINAADDISKMQKLSKKEKKKQKEVKKLNKNKKLDVDKDADETEFKSDNKDKSKKKKKKFLFIN